MAVLKKTTGDSTGQPIEILGDSFVIGRSPDCGLVLDSNGVSRKHAELRRAGNDSHVLLDLHSRNKTKLNGVELVPEQPYPLRPNDKISICEIEFTFNPIQAFVVPDSTKQKSEQKPPGNELWVTEIADEFPVHTLDASRSSAVASALKPEIKLNAILEIARNLSSDLKIDTVAPKILDSLMLSFPQAERSFLIMQEDDGKRLIRKAFKFKASRRSALAQPFTDEIPMSISRSIVRFVIEQKKAVLSQDAGNDANLPTSASIADLKIRSVMCVPLLTPDGKVLGIIQLDTADRKQFGQEDLDVLAAVASQAAIAIQNATLHESMISRERIDRDLKLAEQIQKRFLPQKNPEIPGYEFFSYYLPTYSVGGDYYDFVQRPDNRLGMALADVSGKGIAAALMMAKFSGDTRLGILTKESPSKAIETLNETLCAAGIEEKFITMSLGMLEPNSGRLVLASAGHLPVIVRRADGRVEELCEEITGFPLGIMPGMPYDEVETVLRKGDVVVIFSDGVTDSRSPKEELYDTKDSRRLLARVKNSVGGPIAIGKAILQEIREFSAGHAQADDITLICFGPTA